MKKKALKLIVSIIVPVMSMVFALVFSSVIISETNISEKYESIIAVVIVSFCTIVMSLLLTLLSDMKPIFCVISTIVIMILFRIGVNILLNVPLSLSKQGIVAIIFTFVFSFLGTITGIYFKK